MHFGQGLKPEQEGAVFLWTSCRISVYVLLPDTETALYYLTRMGKTPGQDKRRINKSVKTIQFGCDMAMTQQTLSFQLIL